MIQNHLTSQPLSKRLKELKVPQNSYFKWERPDGSDYDFDLQYKIPGNTFTTSGVKETYSAFLSSELGEIIKEGEVDPVYIWTAFKEITGDHENGLAGIILESTKPETLGLMLEYLILNGLIKI